MRVIAGKYKGKKLSEFELATTRPTSDKIKGALFDKLGFFVNDAVFLDLFAGTGAIGIEAISRGAKKVYFVDNNREAINIIKKNLSLLKDENYEVVFADFKKALQKFEKENVKFDIIFLDPPYKTVFAENCLLDVISAKLTKPNTIFAWEHNNEKQDFLEEFLPISTTKKYGQKYLTYLYMEDLK